MKGVEPLSSGLQDRRSVSQLSYIANKSCESGVWSLESRPESEGWTHDCRPWTPDFYLVELGGVEPPRPACKAGIIPLDHSPVLLGTL
jgi:hypothetical protein